MARDEDEFDPKVPLEVETMTKSEFNRWLTEQDSQVRGRICFNLLFDE